MAWLQEICRRKKRKKSRGTLIPHNNGHKMMLLSKHGCNWLLLLFILKPFLNNPQVIWLIVTNWILGAEKIQPLFFFSVFYTYRMMNSRVWKMYLLAYHMWCVFTALWSAQATVALFSTCMTAEHQSRRAIEERFSGSLSLNNRLQNSWWCRWHISFGNHCVS